jgi:uncharacterized protein YuzE
VEVPGYELSDHAMEVLAEREIATAWVVRVLAAPEHTQLDRSDPDLLHALGRIADALYIRLNDSKVVESEEVQPGIVVDFNAKKQVVGIEVLQLKRRVPKGDLEQLKLLVA